MTELSSRELLDKLRSALSGKTDDVPAGWKTTQQWSEEWGLSRRRCSEIVHNAVKKGLMQVRSLRVRHGQVVRPVQHYKPV